MKSYILIVFSTILFLNSSCTKEDLDVDLINNRWEVISFREAEETEFTFPSPGYILNFNNDEVYSFNLSFNVCGGQYQKIENGTIGINSMTCTLECCEPIDTQKMVSLIPKMSSYYGKGKNLYLEGDGEMLLKAI